MSAANPAFTNIERAPYEFGHLMKALPRYAPQGRALSVDERQQTKAAIEHAHNGNYTLMSGLEAIDQVLFSAATSEANPVDAGILANLALLIKHIAVEAQFLQEQKDELEFSIAADDVRAAAVAVVAPAKKGGAA